MSRGIGEQGLCRGRPRGRGRDGGQQGGDAAAGDLRRLLPHPLLHPCLRGPDAKTLRGRTSRSRRGTARGPRIPGTPISGPDVNGFLPGLRPQRRPAGGRGIVTAKGVAGRGRNATERDKRRGGRSLNRRSRSATGRPSPPPGPSRDQVAPHPLGRLDQYQGSSVRYSPRRPTIFPPGALHRVAGMGDDDEIAEFHGLLLAGCLIRSSDRHRRRQRARLRKKTHRRADGSTGKGDHNP